jgi:hypothetical protein
VETLLSTVACSRPPQPWSKDVAPGRQDAWMRTYTRIGPRF